MEWALRWRERMLTTPCLPSVVPWIEHSETARTDIGDDLLHALYACLQLMQAAHREKHHSRVNLLCLTGAPRIALPRPPRFASSTPRWDPEVHLLSSQSDLFQARTQPIQPHALRGLPEVDPSSGPWAGSLRSSQSSTWVSRRITPRPIKGRRSVPAHRPQSPRRDGVRRGWGAERDHKGGAWPPVGRSS
jgi:hypothetical protein